MHTKRLPTTPRNAIVDHKVIWNTVAPRGCWRYVGNVGAVKFTEDALVVFVPLMRISCMIVLLVFYLQEKQCLHFIYVFYLYQKNSFFCNSEIKSGNISIDLSG